MQKAAFHSIHTGPGAGLVKDGKLLRIRGNAAGQWGKPNGGAAGKIRGPGDGTGG